MVTPPSSTDLTFSSRIRRSNYRIVACLLIICVLLLGLDVWRTWRARSTVLNESVVSTANLARSVAQHAHDTLLAADAMLVGFRESLEGDAASSQALAPLHRVVISQLEIVPLVKNLLAFDASGNCVVYSADAMPRSFNVADRLYFQYHRDHADRQLHVGRPVSGAKDGVYVITLSRRVDDMEGNFRGVVLASIATETLRDFYQTFNVGHDGLIALESMDGYVVSQHPGDDSAVGRDLSGEPVFRDLLPQSALGSWRFRSHLDGVDRVGSYRQVEGYPLVVVVGFGYDEVLAQWRDESLWQFLVTSTTILIITGLGLRFVGRLRLQYRAELDLERRERRYRLLAEHSTDLIIQLGPDLLHVYVSPSSESLLLYRPSELVGLHPRQLAHPDDWPILSSQLSTIAEAGHASPVSYRARRKNGTDIWVEAASRILTDDRGYVVVIRDIAERKETEAQLRQAQRMEAVGQLTAGVAHDFNNMLQAQLGALELLLDEVAGHPRAVQFATMALAAGEHGAKLTHSLLSFSRQQVLEPEAVKIPALLARLERILSRTLGPRILLVFDVEPDLAPVFADAAQLEAALLNLAINARDAMPAGGTLSIQASEASLIRDVPDNLGPGRHLLIAVSDERGGMSPEIVARACEPFFTTKGVGKGSGLGLSMVQGFARQSGGALRFRNGAVLGTRVELWLPVATLSQPAAVSVPPHPVHGSGIVLLVEDVPEVLTVTAEMLHTAGFTVVPVGSGEDALATLERTDVDMLVTDFAMAGIDGGELARRVQSVRPSLPIIILTGFAESEKLASVPSHAVIVRKPISGELLSRRICELLDSKPVRRKAPGTCVGRSVSRVDWVESGRLHLAWYGHIGGCFSSIPASTATPPRAALVKHRKRL